MNTLTLDNAIAHFLGHQTADSIAAMVVNDSSLWGALSGMERFQANFVRREVAEVLNSINAFLVLGSIQRIRPDIAKVVGTERGLSWLGAQLVDLRQRFAG
ncbi:MAG TPA: hypothetical protein VMV23_09380 [Candidatus Nanopelagicaceae bacterium]|nr:hypothetical protein [Candidatus Nanopelagicaceae bacterium]